VVSADGMQACLAAWEQPSETRLQDAQAPRMVGYVGQLLGAPGGAGHHVPP
jgi:hypothetical protein